MVTRQVAHPNHHSSSLSDALSSADRCSNLATYAFANLVMYAFATNDPFFFLSSIVGLFPVVCGVAPAPMHSFGSCVPLLTLPTGVLAAPMPVVAPILYHLRCWPFLWMIVFTTSGLGLFLAVVMRLSFSTHLAILTKLEAYFLIQIFHC